MNPEAKVFSWNFIVDALSQHPASQLKVSGANSSSGVTHLTTDSRKITPGCLFVAIPGEKFDGHAFIAQAIEAGAAGVICRHGTAVAEPLKARCRILEVSDTQETYRMLGGAWRRTFSDIPVILVAGSVGKTTTKELLAALLEGKHPGRVLKTSGSQNGFLGIPMTLLELRRERHDIAVVEVGIDEPETMIHHAALVQATHSVLTAIGPEHLEKLIDIKTVAREEAIALEETVRLGGRAAVNLDDLYIEPLARSLPVTRIRTYSLNGRPAQVQGELAPDGTLRVSATGHPMFTIRTPLPGEHHARNLLAATTLALEVGLSPADIMRGLGDFKGAKGRTEIRPLPGDIRVIADHYNANPSSMLAAFEILKTTPCTAGASRHAVLGDMLELGQDEENWHRNLAAPLLEAGPASVLLHGPRMRWLADELKALGYRGWCSHHETQEELVSRLQSFLNSGDIILLKGSRGMRMEKVLDALSPPRAEVLAATPDALQRAAQLLHKDQVVGMPTETVYGLAGNAFNETALTRIFSTKERPTFDPLIVHITDGLLDTAQDPIQGMISLGLVSTTISEACRKSALALARSFWPGPLTLVLPRGGRIPDLVTSGLPTVAIRMPAHPVARALIEQAGLPLAAPSANRFGRISPTTAQAVQEELGERIPLILDGGPCDIGVESSVVALDADGRATLLRPGGISATTLAACLGAEILLPAKAAPANAPQVAPGMLESHYAPRKPLTLLPAPLSALTPEELLRITAGKKAGFLQQSGAPLAIPGARVLSLSPTNDRAEAARNLFKMLRELDASDAEVLFAEPVPGREGLDHAIADRLARAAAPRR